MEFLHVFYNNLLTVLSSLLLQDTPLTSWVSQPMTKPPNFPPHLAGISLSYSGFQSYHTMFSAQIYGGPSHLWPFAHAAHSAWSTQSSSYLSLSHWASPIT